MSLIQGKNVMGYVYDGGFWKPIVCGLDCSLSTNAGYIGTSIEGSGAWETCEYTGLSWDGSFNGLTYLQMANTIALPDLRNMQFSRQKILYRFDRIDNNSNAYTNEGTALILEISDNGPNESMNSFTMQVKGSGPLTQIFTATPVNPNGKVKILEHTAAGTESSFSSALIFNKDIINVFIDGEARSKIILSGQPLNQEVKYTQSGGQGIITYPSAIGLNTEVRIEYQDI